MTCSHCGKAVDADAVVAARIATLTDRDLLGIAERAVETFRDDGSDIPERIRWWLRARLLREEEPRG